MDDLRKHAAKLHLSAETAHRPERRRHARMECIARQRPAQDPGETRSGQCRPSFLNALLIRVGLAARPVSPLSYGACIVAAQDRRLPEIVARLEAILNELDALEAWREASDVCAAIERLRARAAQSGPT
jgi:hypothetical protein